MASQPSSALTIRGLAPAVKSSLRTQAAHKGRSMEAEARAILEAAVRPKIDEVDFATFVRSIVEPPNGFELRLPRRELVRAPPDFSDDSPELDHEP